MHHVTLVTSLSDSSALQGEWIELELRHFTRELPLSNLPAGTGRVWSDMTRLFGIGPHSVTMGPTDSNTKDKVDTCWHTTSHYITLPVNSQNVALDLVTWCDLRLHLIPQMFPRTAPFQGSHWDSRWLVRLELCGSLAMKFRAAMCMSIFLQYVYGVLVLSSFSSCVPSKRFR